MDKAVAAARAAFKTWRFVPSAQRAAMLLKLADLIDENVDTLAAFETEAMGMPISGAKSVVGMCTGQLRYYAGLAGKIHGDTIPDDGSGLAKLVYYEPIGVCGAIAPWNATMLFWAWKVSPLLSLTLSTSLQPSLILSFISLAGSGRRCSKTS